MEVKKSADIFFSKVDFIKEFELIGGEPLLYHDLTKAIQYIWEKYRQYLSVYCIATNGTIVPSEDVLEVCSQYHVLFRISNYSAQIPRFKEIHQGLNAKLEKWHISYVLGEEDWQWRDYGFEYVDHGTDENMLLLQGKNYKKELLEFSMEYSNKGYSDMCRHCHGSKAYEYMIPVAEQF